MHNSKQSPYVDYYESPIGLFEICATESAITHVLFAETSDRREISSSALVRACRDQLIEYFQGQRQVFELTLAPCGTTFQKSVWSELRKIPYGETTSYLEIGRRLGNIKAVRAVGGANGKNPINIIVPCHRVIGANGMLVGYGGGLWRKQWLLNHEKSSSR